MDKPLKQLLWLTLGFKVAVLLAAFLAPYFFSFNTANYLANFHYPANALPDTWTSLKTWDAQHYLCLADQGYSPGDWDNVFFPLWPFLIHLTGPLFFGNNLAAGLVLSLLFTLASMVFLYLLVKPSCGTETAFNTGLFLLAFPTGFYMSLVYTEALFLTLATAYFYFSREGKIGPAAFCAFLLPLTRPLGVLILPAACLWIWTSKKKKSLSFWRLLEPAGFLLGFELYLMLMKAFTGDYWAGFSTQGHYLSHNDLSHLMNPFQWFFNNFIHIHYSLLGVENDPLNRLFFLAFVAALVLSYRILDKGLWAYALILGLFPAMISDLMSYMRYLVGVFPLFIFLAQKWGPQRKYYLLACLPLQGVFLVLHALNDWVA